MVIVKRTNLLFLAIDIFVLGKKLRNAKEIKFAHAVKPNHQEPRNSVKLGKHKRIEKIIRRF